MRALIAAGLAVVGIALVWPALTGPPGPGSALAGAPTGRAEPSTSTDAPTTAAARPAAGADEIDVRDKITGVVLPESDPVEVSIPKIGARSRLVELGLRSDGEMEVPDDPSRAGWFTRGAAPGALGPAVIAGHVTWDGSPAIFHRLDTLKRGDQVIVTRKDGRAVVFTVTKLAQFSKSRFPSRAVYGSIDHAGLRLITCGGSYDTARRRYLDNVIVFARLESVRGPGA